MTKKKYPLSMEIAGPFAMFTRPDTGCDSSSYIAPTKTAVKGMIEAVLNMHTVEINPTRVEICSRVKFQPWKFNSHVFNRKSDQIASENALQIGLSILVDVCYKLYATVSNADIDRIRDFLSEKEKRCVDQGIDNACAYQSQFERWLKQGKSYRTPHLGLSEFLASYYGPIRKETKIDKSINKKIPFFLNKIWTFPTFGECVKPEFITAEVKQGVLSYVS